MKKLIFSIIILLGMTNLSAQKKDILSAGTIVPIYFTHQICSDGENQIRAFVNSNILGDSGRVVIKAGTPVVFNMNIRSAGPWGRSGRIEVTAISVLATDGQEISINGSDLITGKSRKGAAIGGSVALGLTFVPILGFGLGFFIKGEEVCLQHIPVVRTVTETIIKTK